MLPPLSLPLLLAKDQNSGISIKLEFVIAAAQQAEAQDWLSGMRRLIKMQPEGGARREASGKRFVRQQEAPAQKDNAPSAFELFKCQCAQPFCRVDFFLFFLLLIMRIISQWEML